MNSNHEFYMVLIGLIIGSIIIFIPFILEQFALWYLPLIGFGLVFTSTGYWYYRMDNPSPFGRTKI